MKLNENIKKLRKENKFTQQQLADKLFVSQDSISAWERNVSAPPTEYLPSLAAIFHVSIDDLFGDDFKTQTAKGNPFAVCGWRYIFSGDVWSLSFVPVL